MRTAFLAGMWSGVVLVTYAYLVEPNLRGSSTENAGFFIVGLIGLAPAFLFVFGDWPDPVGSVGMRLGTSLRYVGEVVKRQFSWLAGAAVAGFPLSLVVRFAEGAT